MKILVLEKFAEHYRSHLSSVTGDITYASCTDNLNQDFDILLAQPDLAAAYVRGGGRVKWIQSTWAGVRPLADALEDSSILVTGIKDVFGPQIAEYVFTYLLEEIRQPEIYRGLQRERQWQPELPDTAADHHMVIVGTGSIGRHLARVAQGFGIRVTGVSRSGTAVSGFNGVVPVKQLGEAVIDADYVVLVLPDTPAATGLLDADIFSAMHNKPLLFNVGRGNTVDDATLLKALQEGQIRGAVLDVFETEPLPDDSPLWSQPGVVITPHVAAVSYPADIAEVFLRNLEKYTASESLDFVVDLTRGY